MKIYEVLGRSVFKEHNSLVLRDIIFMDQKTLSEGIMTQSRFYFVEERLALSDQFSSVPDGIYALEKSRNSYALHPLARKFPVHCF